MSDECNRLIVVHTVGVFNELLQVNEPIAKLTFYKIKYLNM